MRVPPPANALRSEPASDRRAARHQRDLVHRDVVGVEVGVGDDAAHDVRKFLQLVGVAVLLDAAVDGVRAMARPGDLVFLKGSLATGLSIIEPEAE